MGDLQLQRLEELVVLGVGPALTRLGDGVGLAHPPGPLIVFVPYRHGRWRGGLPQAHPARLLLLAASDARDGRIEGVRRCGHGHHRPPQRAADAAAAAAKVSLELELLRCRPSRWWRAGLFSWPQQQQQQEAAMVAAAATTSASPDSH
nr:unnamed protein product [Digitaria exilis]